MFIESPYIVNFNYFILLMVFSIFRDQVVISGKKRGHDGSEKATVKVQGVLHYPELNKVLVLPNTKQNISVKKVKRRNELFFLMLGKS